MLALAVIVVMLLLAVLLTVSYFPRLRKPFTIKRDFSLETAEEIAPRHKINDEPHFIDDEPKFKVVALESPPINYEVPHKYEADKIALLVRDPEWLFAYWEISSATCEHVASKHQDLFNKSIPVLRVFNITDSQGAPEFFDIDLAGDAMRCHIHVQKPNNKFYVAIGRRKHDGEFVPILYSNVVMTPRSAVSPHFDKDWLPPLEYAHLLYKDAGLFSSFEAAKERND